MCHSQLLCYCPPLFVVQVWVKRHCAALLATIKGTQRHAKSFGWMIRFKFETRELNPELKLTAILGHLDHALNTVDDVCPTLQDNWTDIVLLIIWPRPLWVESPSELFSGSAECLVLCVCVRSGEDAGMLVQWSCWNKYLIFCLAIKGLSSRFILHYAA